LPPTDQEHRHERERLEVAELMEEGEAARRAVWEATPEGTVHEGGMWQRDAEEGDIAEALA
jgi:hypothetical protein